MTHAPGCHALAIDPGRGRVGSCTCGARRDRPDTRTLHLFAGPVAGTEETMSKKSKKNEEREAADVEREMDAAAGPMDEEDYPPADEPEEEDGLEDTEEADDEEDDATAEAVELTAEEEERAERVLAALRASESGLTVDKLHPEVNTEGSPDYVPAGQVEKVLGALLLRGLVEREGEAWTAVRPGVLAKRRGELLADTIDYGGDWIVETAQEQADFDALANAGFVEMSADGKDVHVAEDVERRVLVRGAIAEVESALAECRPVGVAAVVTDGNPAEALAKEQAARKAAEKARDDARKESAEQRKLCDKFRGDVDVCRAWFKENNLPCPLGKPEVPKPEREEFTHTITPSAADKGRMYGIRLKLQARLAEADAALLTAKGSHKARSEMLNGRIKALDDAVTGLFYDATVFRRVDLGRGVAQIVHAEDESWVLDEKELRSEQIAEEKGKATVKAEPAPKAEAPTATAADTMQVIPAGAPPADGTVKNAVKGLVDGLAKEGMSLSVDTSGPVPVFTASDKPKAPALTPENVQAELVKIVGELPTDTATLTTGEVTDMIAERWGVEAGTGLGQLVKLAARKAYEKGLVRHSLEGGAERVSRMPQKALDDSAAAALEEIRKAGAEGVKLADLPRELREHVEPLVERGAVVKNGKRGAASRVVAKEHAPKTNGVAAEALA